MDFFTPAKIASYTAMFLGPLLAYLYGIPFGVSLSLCAAGAVSAFLWCWDDLTAIARKKILDLS